MKRLSFLHFQPFQKDLEKVFKICELFRVGVVDPEPSTEVDMLNFYALFFKDPQNLVDSFDQLSEIAELRDLRPNVEVDPVEVQTRAFFVDLKHLGELVNHHPELVSVKPSL